MYTTNSEKKSAQAMLISSGFTHNLTVKKQYFLNDIQPKKMTYLWNSIEKRILPMSVYLDLNNTTRFKKKNYTK